VLVKDGVLVPLEPLPADWREGEAIDVCREPGAETSAGPDADDAFWDRLEQLVAEIDPQDVRRMQAALDEHRREAKEWMRRRMGLS
jgi:hypothetical protein